MRPQRKDGFTAHICTSGTPCRGSGTTTPRPAPGTSDDRYIRVSLNVMGHAKHNKDEDCRSCKGSGTVKMGHNGDSTEVDCPVCYGSGKAN